MIKNYSALHESMQTRTLANGLRICYLPKEGFSKTFAILATDFGSVDASFTFEGKRYDTPALRTSLSIRCSRMRTAMHCRNSPAPVQARTRSQATP